MVPGARRAGRGPCPGVGVVMAAVVCWPLTRRVKMPQNQGKCFIARYKLQRRSWNNNGAPNRGGQRVTESGRESENEKASVVVCRGILQQHWQHFLRSRTHTQRHARSWQMPWQSDVQSQKAYVLRIESCSPTLEADSVLLC